MELTEETKAPIELPDMTVPLAVAWEDYVKLSASAQRELFALRATFKPSTCRELEAALNATDAEVAEYHRGLAAGLAAEHDRAVATPQPHIQTSTFPAVAQASALPVAPGEHCLADMPWENGDLSGVDTCRLQKGHPGIHRAFALSHEKTSAPQPVAEAVEGK